MRSLEKGIILPMMWTCTSITSPTSGRGWADIPDALATDEP
jgi:hypothetical protein